MIAEFSTQRAQQLASWLSLFVIDQSLRLRRDSALFRYHQPMRREGMTDATAFVFRPKSADSKLRLTDTSNFPAVETHLLDRLIHFPAFPWYLEARWRVTQSQQIWGTALGDFFE
jgi:hypothetical protein